jgi:hypothetical protein
MGTVYAINQLLNSATGDYVFGIAADDKLAPGFLEKSMGLLSHYPQAGLCSALTYIIDENGTEVDVRCPVVSNEPRFFTPDEVRSLLLKYCWLWVLSNTTIVHREAALEAGGFISELGPFCDGFLWHMIILRYGACFVPEQLAYMRQLKTSFSANTLSTVESSLTIGQYASNLMKNTHRDLFPQDYVVEWEKQWKHDTGRRAWEKVKGIQQGFVNDSLTTLRSSPSWIDLLIRIGTSLLILAQDVLVKAYLLAKFTPWRRYMTYYKLMKRL